MAKYLAVYDVLVQPFEEAPDKEKRIYDITAENDDDAKWQAEAQRMKWLRDELLPGSTVTLEHLVEARDVKR